MFVASTSDDTRYHVHDAITVDMTTASAAIPLLLNSVRVDDADLCDGGLLVNVDRKLLLLGNDLAAIANHTHAAREPRPMGQRGA